MTRAAAYPLLLALLVAAVFANALGGAFVFDDVADVTRNASARAESFFERLPAMNRPLTKASYALQDAVHGPWEAGFHAVNTLLHLAATLLAFALLRRAGGLAGLDQAKAALLAFAAAAVWAVHPALTDTVTYVSGRTMGLSAALMLGALMASSGALTRSNAALAFATAALAVLARETALVLPAILIWWQMTLQREPWRVALRRAAPVMAGTLVAAVLIFALPRHQMLVAESLRSRPPLDALLGNLHAAAEILMHWFAPWRVTIDPTPPLEWGWADPRTLAKLALFAGLAAFAIVARRRLPLIAFGVGLALLALAPSNTLLWRADPVSLKPLYLSGLGLTLALAALALKLRVPVKAIGAAALALIVTLGTMTVQRNALFADEIALWRDATQTTPDYGRPWIMLGYALFNAGRYEEAEAALQQGTALAPWDDEAAHALALVRSILNSR